jgi:hypothetical protein
MIPFIFNSMGSHKGGPYIFHITYEGWLNIFFIYKRLEIRIEEYDYLIFMIGGRFEG